MNTDNQIQPHSDVTCPKYKAEVLPDENGNCSLCSAPLVHPKPEKLVIPESAEDVMALMKEKSALLGKYEILRQTGHWISPKEVNRVFREFNTLSKVYKKKYFAI